MSVSIIPSSPSRKSGAAHGTQRKHSAFTLIELLVVIAIIAILAAILFPVFAQAREKARQTTCASNMKQISTATLTYIQDYDETYPLAMGWSATAGNAGAGTYYYSKPTAAAQGLTLGPTSSSIWANALDSYIKNWQVWACPSTARELNVFNETDDKLAGIKFSYLYNPFLNAWPAAFIKQPAETVTYTELANMSIRGYLRPYPLMTDNGCSITTMDVYQFDRTKSNGRCDFGYVYEPSWWTHGQGTNMPYADGHVKWVRNSSSNSHWANNLSSTGQVVNGTTSYWVSGTAGDGTWLYWLGPVGK